MVFVSYRRDDSGMVAIDVARELGELIDGEVFFDLGSISVGQQFNDEIAAALGRSSVVVVLLGRDWAGLVPGGRRIDDVNDVFRREIETALASDAAVIPVMLGDLRDLASDDLPPSLRPLAQRQYHRIRLENKWAAIRSLAELVRNTIEEQRYRRLYETAATGSSMYKMVFDPQQTKSTSTTGLDEPYGSMLWPEDVVFRVNVALATERLLVVVGSDGSERDALAYSIARNLGWSVYSFEYSAATTPKDLLYSVDETRRLADAQAGQLKETSTYLEPGVLWWAFDPESARRRGAQNGSVSPAFDPGWGEGQQPAGAVVQLSGDAPGNLRDYLRPVGRRDFFVREIGFRVQASKPVLVVLSTPDIRSVEHWIRQRAVVCHLRAPTPERMMDMAERATKLPPEIIERVIKESIAMQEAAGREGSLDPRTILDALRAVERLSIDVTDSSRDWRALLDTLMPG